MLGRKMTTFANDRTPSSGARWVQRQWLMEPTSVGHPAMLGACHGLTETTCGRTLAAETELVADKGEGLLLSIPLQRPREPATRNSQHDGHHVT